MIFEFVVAAGTADEGCAAFGILDTAEDDASDEGISEDSSALEIVLDNADDTLETVDDACEDDELLPPLHC
mgnify:CR=1 FL=1